MGMDIPVQLEEGQSVNQAEMPPQDSQYVNQGEMLLRDRPSVILVGPPDVGKRTILERLLSKGRAADVVSVGDVTGHGWTIDTKYYTANLCIWMAHIKNKHISTGTTGHSLLEHCEALVMVFDLTIPSSFGELQDWASGVDLHMFEILLCVGNKADRVPDHFGHSEYRRRLGKHGESSSDPHPEYADFGIHEWEGASLLEAEVSPVDDLKTSRLEWCAENGIEYLEACAINEAFDHCMSVNGDMQGIARLQGALSAHMWPGMIVKPLNKLTDTADVKPENGRDSSGSSGDSDSDYTFEYERLSNASGDICEDEHLGGYFSGEAPSGNNVDNGYIEPNIEEEPAVSLTSQMVPSGTSSLLAQNALELLDTADGVSMEASESISPLALPEQLSVQSNHSNTESSLDDLDQLMQDMAAMREHMKMMPDAHRREMAARFAMRMAAMFGEDEDGDE